MVRGVPVLPTPLALMEIACRLLHTPYPLTARQFIPLNKLPQCQVIEAYEQALSPLLNSECASESADPPASRALPEFTRTDMSYQTEEAPGVLVELALIDSELQFTVHHTPMPSNLTIGQEIALLWLSGRTSDLSEAMTAEAIAALVNVGARDSYIKFLSGLAKDAWEACWAWLINNREGRPHFALATARRFPEDSEYRLPYEDPLQGLYEQI